MTEDEPPYSARRATRARTRPGYADDHRPARAGARSGRRRQRVIEAPEAGPQETQHRIQAKAKRCPQTRRRPSRPGPPSCRPARDETAARRSRGRCGSAAAADAATGQQRSPRAARRRGRRARRHGRGGDEPSARRAADGRRRAQTRVEPKPLVGAVDASGCRVFWWEGAVQPPRRPADRARTSALLLLRSWWSRRYRQRAMGRASAHGAAALVRLGASGSRRGDEQSCQAPNDQRVLRGLRTFNRHREGRDEARRRKHQRVRPRCAQRLTEVAGLQTARFSTRFSAMEGGLRP